MGLRKATTRDINDWLDRIPVWYLMDMLCLTAGFMLLTGLFRKEDEGIPAWLTFTGIYVVCAEFLLWGFDMYSIVLCDKKVILVTSILSALYTLVLAGLIGMIFCREAVVFPAYAAGCAAGFFLFYLWRIFLYDCHARCGHRKKMLMIEQRKEDNSRVRRMKYACLTQFDAWYEQVDVTDLEGVGRFIEAYFPQYDVICMMESIPHEVRDMLVNAGSAMGKEMFIVPAMYEINFVKVKLSALDDIMVLHLQPCQIGWIDLAVKRLMDIVLSAVACVVAAVPMLFLAALIKLTSPGPVIYKQKRLTKGKREFDIYKFRSMVQDAEAISGPVLAEKDDPRITSVGRWMRKMRLDELPQLFNILKGDMSIVGPRPERPFFVEKYEQEIEDYDKRFAVRAGLTALSHVYGRYSTEAIDRTRYDLMYIQNYSLWLDIRIILLTTRTVLIGKNAEGVSEPYQYSQK